MLRRSFLRLGPGLAPLVRPALAQGSRDTLTFVPQVDLAILDPVFTRGSVTRNHGYLVFDTLYGIDEHFAAHPQMAAGHVVADDGKLWTITLREGLRFHDDSPVLARDCVASIRRWARADGFGQALMAVTDDLSAPDDTTIRFRLQKPFPLLALALGKPGANMCAIMPERLASQQHNRQVTEMVGSGPYRFRADQRLAGARVVYEKFDGYVPRPAGGPVGLTTGPKVAHIPRIEWHVMPDAATATSALRQSEVDWIEQISSDLLPLLRRDAGIATAIKDPEGSIGFIRFNQLHPPFDNPGIRRALLGAIDQTASMMAVAGEDESLWRDGVGFFTPSSPMANDAGIAVMTSPRDMTKVRRDLEAAGYRGERVVMLGAGDLPTLTALSEVTADALRRAGINLDFQVMDWGTVLSRLTSREPNDKGGWNLYCSSTDGANMLNPAAHAAIRGNGARAPGYGWPTAPKLEDLRSAWFDAATLADQQRICREIQMQAWQDVPYIPAGLFLQTTAYRTSVSGVIPGFPAFYNVRKG